MKRALPLVLLLAACSTAGGDTTTTTAPLAEPSTTTTAPRSITTTTEPTTTTTAPPTTTTEPRTTTEDECVERDGLARDRRGTICPPYLSARTVEDVALASINYRPGTYTTRTFQPAFRFTRTTQFQTSGENVQVVVLDDRLGCDHAFCQQRVMILSPTVAAELAALDLSAFEGITGIEASPAEPAEHSTVIELAVADNAGSPGCTVYSRYPVPGTSVPGFGLSHCARVRVAFIDVGETTVAYLVEKHEPEFDTYWTEVAQPILESIEFLDR